MTKVSEVLNDPKYIAVLDHGFVGLVDHMGNDGAIVQAARVSYGDGTKTVLEDRGLIRYLMSHKHTSPFEMCQIKLHLKMPIFVMRQWVRHRTASLNEYSGRYSVMTDEFYLPEPEMIKAQSKDNKQGRSGAVSEKSATGVRWMMEAAHSTSYEVYQALLGEKDGSKYGSGEVIYDPYQEGDELFGDEFEGIARESARAVLPVSNYTELYWSQNLHNMMHLLKLRLDEHAQYEIRVFAQAVYDLIKPLFPEALQAFDDYVREASSNSRLEINVLQKLLSSGKEAAAEWYYLLTAAGSDKALGAQFDMSLREIREFAKKWSFPVTADLAPTPAEEVVVEATPVAKPRKRTPKAKA